jgi:hypothetical protein
MALASMSLYLSSKQDNPQLHKQCCCDPPTDPRLNRLMVVQRDYSPALIKVEVIHSDHMTKRRKVCYHGAKQFIYNYESDLLLSPPPPAGDYSGLATYCLR